MKSYFITYARIYEKKTQFYGIGQKIKNARKNCSRFSDIVKLTSKFIQVYEIKTCFII